jgi:hypothetical protein
MKIFFKIVLVLIFLWVIFYLWLITQQPEHNRNWESGQEKLPKIELEGEKIKVINFRDFKWQEDGVAITDYHDEYFNLNQLEGVDVIISHFAEFEGLAHIFLSFRFSDNKNMVISVETRRETGEEFSPWLGLMRRFEIIYVVGSERDIIGVRTDIRQERVYLYPTLANPEKSRDLLLALIKDINNIYNQPTFYNTLLNNCTNVITRRVEDISEIKFPLTYKTILPGFMDEVLYKIKLIPHDKSFQENKQYYLIDNDEVNRLDVDYSQKIRR